MALVTSGGYTQSQNTVRPPSPGAGFTWDGKAWVPPADPMDAFFAAADRGDAAAMTAMGATTGPPVMAPYNSGGYNTPSTVIPAPTPYNSGGFNTPTTVRPDVGTSQVRPDVGTAQPVAQVRPDVGTAQRPVVGTSQVRPDVGAAQPVAQTRPVVGTSQVRPDVGTAQPAVTPRPVVGTSQVRPDVGAAQSIGQRPDVGTAIRPDVGVSQIRPEVGAPPAMYNSGGTNTADTRPVVGTSQIRPDVGTAQPYNSGGFNTPARPDVGTAQPFNSGGFNTPARPDVGTTVGTGMRPDVGTGGFKTGTFDPTATPGAGPTGPTETDYLLRGTGATSQGGATPNPLTQQSTIDQQAGVGLQGNLAAPGGTPQNLGGDVFQYEAPNALPGFAGISSPLAPGQLPAYRGTNQAMPQVQNAPQYQGPTGAMPGAGVTGLQGQDAVTQQLMGVMQGTQQMPGLDALQRNISREQDQQRRQQAEQMALRGVGNSTINDTAMNDLAARQADEMTTRMTGAQAQLLSNYTGNLGALQQGNLNQQGQAFGQGMATRQQGANESIQDFQARLAGQGQQYGQGLANRQQGSNEALQQYQALMGGQGQSFNQALQGRQQGAAEEAQRYQQLSGTRGQSLNEFFGFSDRQQQMDAQLYNQQLGALQLGLGAMGNVNTGGGQMQTVPQSGSAAGSIAGAMTQTAPYWMPGLFDGGGGGTSNDVKQPAGANVW